MVGTRNPLILSRDSYPSVGHKKRLGYIEKEIQYYLYLFYFLRYVEWSSHEPEEGWYQFEGDNDIASFIKIAAEEDLHVLLRPGPYICAERDLVKLCFHPFLEV